MQKCRGQLAGIKCQGRRARKVPGAKVTDYNTINEAFMALKNGNVDAFLKDFQNQLVQAYGITPVFENIPIFVAAVIACSLNSGAYIAEIFRAGVQSIERGQMEAARSLGMTHG